MLVLRPQEDTAYSGSFKLKEWASNVKAFERPTTAESALPTQPCEWPVSCSLSYANEVEQ